MSCFGNEQVCLDGLNINISSFHQFCYNSFFQLPMFCRTIQLNSVKSHLFSGISYIHKPFVVPLKFTAFKYFSTTPMTSNTKPASINNEGQTSGHYSGKDGQFNRKPSVFRNWISKKPGAEFPPEKNRYHLYVSLACPW